MRNEKFFLLAVKSSVQIKDPSVHVDEDHVTVKDKPWKHHDWKNYEACYVASGKPSSLSLIEVVPKLEHIPIPVLTRQIEEQRQRWV